MTEPDNGTDLIEYLMAKRELLIVPPTSEITLNEVILQLHNLKLDGSINCFSRNHKFIARFKTDQEMEDALEKIKDSEEMHEYSVVKVYTDESKVTIHDTFPVSKLTTFMKNYNAKHNTQPDAVIPPPTPPTKKVLRMRSDDGSRLLRSKLRLHKCKQCAAPCTYKCVRTDRPFCSMECQAKFAKIELPKEMVGTEISNAAANDHLTGKKFLLVGFSYARTVFLRSVSDTVRYIGFMNELAVMAKSAKKFNRFAVSRPVLAFYKDQWHRGIITLVFSNTLGRVALPDLGVEEVFLLRHLKQPEEIDEPITLLKCTLEDVERDGISFDCVKLLERLQKEETIFLADSNDPEKMVLKLNTVGGRNIADLINPTMTMEVEVSGTSYYVKDLPVLDMKSRSNVPMLITDASDAGVGLSLAQGEYFKWCYRYESHFQEFPEKVPGNYTPSDKELCLVKLKSPDQQHERWFRAFGVLNCGDQYPRVELVDYGSLVKVHVSCIRKLPKELLYPAATLIYTPGDNSVIDRSVIAFFGVSEEILWPIVMDRIEEANGDCHTDRFYCEKFKGQLLI